MAKETISFNELRRIKDSLPDGSMHKICLLYTSDAADE